MPASRFLICAAALAAAPLLSVQAQTSGHAHNHAAASADSQTTWAEGEVRRIDKDNRKITLRHGEIKNLNMPPMSMVFQVKDPALLDKAAVGAKVRFQAVQEGGSYLLTALEAAKP